ncbi:MAG: hypothetical protein Ct9H90mP22_8510 [Gammaproteobacteria bacterium]|nr:MAG: hypothetical protein Ct9H90mP22_8510 [Gammaproteobacteria bacterium]
MVNLVYGNKNIQEFKKIMDIRFKFMKFRKIAGLISITLFLISCVSLGLRGLV